MVYKGYHIGHTLLGKWFVMRDGVHICWADSKEDAKRKIDELIQA